MSKGGDSPGESGRLEGAREYARKHAKEAVTLLAHAVNACDREGATYRYAANEQQTFERLLTDLVNLIERGNIESLARRHAHSPPKLVRRKPSKPDPLFDAFLRDVMVSKKRRPKGSVRSKIQRDGDDA